MLGGRQKEREENETLVEFVANGGGGRAAAAVRRGGDIRFPVHPCNLPRRNPRRRREGKTT